MEPNAPAVAETGNGFIDSTHVVLLRRIAEIRALCADGAPRQTVVPDLDSFFDDMSAHFAHEELILRASGYDHWEEHAEHHGTLGRQVGRLVEYLRECDVSQDFLCTVTGTLDAVLSQHEIKHDGAYAGLLSSAQVPAPGEDLIVWTRAFETGVEPIDRQHRELAALVNEMHRLAHGVHGTADALALLDRVRRHVRAHFDTEEQVMRATSPSRCLNHAASHKMMEAQFVAMRAQVAEGMVDLGVAVRDFLRFWLMDHILVCDRPHFLVMGMAPPAGKAA